MIRKIWYFLNATFGERIYFHRDNILYIKEGFNKPEVFTEHLKNHHIEQYINYKGRL